MYLLDGTGNSILLNMKGVSHVSWIKKVLEYTIAFFGFCFALVLCFDLFINPFINTTTLVYWLGIIVMLSLLLFFYKHTVLHRFVCPKKHVCKLPFVPKNSCVKDNEKILYESGKARLLRNSSKWLVIGTWLFFSLLLVVLLYIGYFLRVNPTWDFGFVYRAAANLSQNDWTSYYTEGFNYLNTYQNNICISLLFAFLFKIAQLFPLGTLNFINAGIIFNSLCIWIAFILIYRLQTLRYNQKTALYTTFLLSLFIPIYLYLPVFYTDTVSFPISAFILYIFYRYKHEPSKKKRILLFFLFCFAGVLSLAIKVNTFFVVIAILIAQCLKKWNWRNIRNSIFIVLVCSICFLGIKNYGKLLIGISGSEEAMPMTHYFMIGMEGNGGYSDEALSYTNSFTTRKEKQEANIKRIKENLKNKGLTGYVSFLGKKAILTWGDGTYNVWEKLADAPVDSNSFRTFVIHSKGLNPIIESFCEVFHACILIFLGIALIRLIMMLLKNRNQEVDLIGLANIIAAIGTFIFFLFWEAKTRYIFNFIPILALIAVDEIIWVNNRILKQKLLIKGYIQKWKMGNKDIKAAPNSSK